MDGVIIDTAKQSQVVYSASLVFQTSDLTNVICPNDMLFDYTTGKCTVYPYQNS